jgi:tripartite-type tricarboxylate transporter receptor subunit TctC
MPHPGAPGPGRRALLTAAAAAPLAAPFPARAQSTAAWPGGQTVSVVIPYAPGGASDVVGRLLTAGLQERLGGAFVMDHRPGASTGLAARHVARAKPDGLTLLLGTIATFTLTPLAFRAPGYDPIADFEHITMLCETLSLLVAHPRWSSLGGLLAAAKTKPGALSYASWGVGTTAHLPMVDLCGRAGVEMLHVPYNGAPPALTDIIAGRTDCMFALLAACKPHLEAGRLRALAVPTPARPAALPDVPTFEELGFSDFVYTGWYSLEAPTGTPEPILDRLSDAAIDTFKDPRTRELMASQGIARAPGGKKALLARIEHELPLHRELMRKAGMVPE